MNFWKITEKTEKHIIYAIIATKSKPEKSDEKEKNLWVSRIFWQEVWNFGVFMKCGNKIN